MEEYEILHNFDVLDLFEFPSFAPWKVPRQHYRLSYGGIWNPAQFWSARFVWVFLFCSLVSASSALPTELWRNIWRKARLKSNLCRSVGAYLFSRAVASQVSSARQSLTSVFGMGTGGPSALITPTRSIQSCDCTDIWSWTLHSAMHLQGFEPGTHWLRVSCSTNWAKGAYFLRTLIENQTREFAHNNLF